MNMRPTKHEKQEWHRLAEAAFKLNRYDTAHKFRLASGIPENGEMQRETFDHLQAEYRSWLNDGFEPDITVKLATFCAQIEKQRSDLRHVLIPLVHLYAGQIANTGEYYPQLFDAARTAIDPPETGRVKIQCNHCGAVSSTECSECPQAKCSDCPRKPAHTQTI